VLARPLLVFFKGIKMAGWNTIQEIRRLEEAFDKLGLKIAKARESSWANTIDFIALIPKDADSLPIYSRDAEVFIGTIEDARQWLRGLTWAREYDMLIRLSDDKKRTRKEQDERNRQLVRMLKNEKVDLK